MRVNSNVSPGHQSGLIVYEPSWLLEDLRHQDAPVASASVVVVIGQSDNVLDDLRYLLGWQPETGEINPSLAVKFQPEATRLVLRHFGQIDAHRRLVVEGTRETSTRLSLPLLALLLEHTRVPGPPRPGLGWRPDMRHPASQICGLPPSIEGKTRQFRHGTGGFAALRSGTTLAI